jgi:hypothetical protein
MKRFCLLLALFFVLTAGGVFAHEKGDLVLNIEPQTGWAFPNFGLFMMREFVPGLDISLRTTADYYLTDSFAVSAGLGYGFNYHFLIAGGGIHNPRWDAAAGAIIFAPFTFGLSLLGLANLPKDEIVFDAIVLEDGDFFASYITIPFGIRYSPQPFTAGAGLTANFPVYGFGVQYIKQWERAEPTAVTFKLRPYLGWYLDIGFDRPGKKKGQNSFGMLFRLGGQFIKEIAEPSVPWFNWEHEDSGIAIESGGPLSYQFNFVSASIVFKFGIGLGNYFIKGKKE